MTIRRIVTGHNAAGKSGFVSDSAATRTTVFQHVRGFVTSLLWETLPGAKVPAQARDPAVAATSWVPAPGGSNLLFIIFPPDSVVGSPDFDPPAAGGEYMSALPGLAEKFEMDNPGMHCTDTVDYAVLLEGEIDLELDDGASRQLAPKDVVIQNGSRHAWRNKSDKPATMLFVLVGAVRN